MEFYSVVLKKKIDIPKSKTREIIKNTKRGKRKFIVGKYKANGKEYEAWRIVSMKTKN